MKIRNINKLVLLITLLSFLFLLIDFGLSKSIIIRSIGYYLYYFVILLFLISVFTDFVESKYNIKTNFLDLFFFILLVVILVFNKFIDPFFDYNIKVVIICVVIVRNFLFFYKSSGEKKNIRSFSKKMLVHPAKTLIVSYLSLIFLGTLLLMLPFSTVGGVKSGFINSLFTATSAVSVTGLTVFDTPTYYTTFGQIVILLLIQVGGLGIMIFSFFTAFIIGRKVSVEDRITMSFMVSESDMKNISRTIRNIVLITLIIEFFGAFLLMIKFSLMYGLSIKPLYLSIFHSISAFCNAGFSLFSNNLYDFKSNIYVNLVICFLIITGGLSFSVITNMYDVLKSFINNKILNRKKAFAKLSLNSIIVLSITSILIVAGTLLFYGFEHHNILLKESILTQYLSSFFQSVTCRTAGFNTLDLSNLNTYTYLIMIILMFIGGASGSTAGGVKVNTLGVIFAYFKSVLNNDNNVVLFKKSVSKELITRGFLVITIGFVVVFVASLILSISERFSLIQIVFEVTSAFGTVGLSTGITSSLSYIGKVVIILLMFIGKVGPLTLLLAASKKARNTSIEYPQGEINIG